MKTTMKLLLVVLLAFMVAGFSGESYADMSGEATAHVYVVVNPDIAVQPLTANVDAGSVQYGNFSATVRFRVDANKEAVVLGAGASPLFKGDDPSSSIVSPIPLAAGVTISPTNANPVQGGSNVANYQSPCDVASFPGLCTNSIIFESSQNGHFSQDVSLTFTWNQDDHEKPMGEYSGKVKLIAFLLP